MSTPDGKKNASSQLVESNVAGGITRDENSEEFSPEWCQELLNNPIYDQAAPYSRGFQESSGSSHSSLMSKTLFTNQTIRAMRYLYKPRQSTKPKDKEVVPDKDGNRIGGELLALVSLGGEMCSHNDTLHGGINTVLIDEIGGDLAFREIPAVESLMAVNFNINLRKSVKTPGIVLGRSWIERPPERRKVWVKVRLEQDGQSCIDGEILYLKMNVQASM